LVREVVKVRIVVDIDKCIGAGQCVRAADTVFSQDEDTGVVVLLEENPPEERRKAVSNAARVCPVNAITIED
jgi:ferredoxin